MVVTSIYQYRRVFPRVNYGLILLIYRLMVLCFDGFN